MNNLSLVVLLFSLGASVVTADEKPFFHATVGRNDTRIRFVSDGGTTVFDVISVFGIDKATIKRESKKWPKTTRVRLHLKGLESFKAGNGKVVVEWSVSSTGKNLKRVSLRKGKDQTTLDAKSPYYTGVQILGGNGRIPLKDGYFEVLMPAKLFEGNPEKITLSWIDFYRN